MIGDNLGRLNTLYLATLSLGLLCIVWLFAKTTLLIILFTIFFGFLSGTFTALLPPVVSQISPDEKLGARMGAFYSVICVSSLTGAPIAGLLIGGENRGGYAGVILFAVSTKTNLKALND